VFNRKNEEKSFLLSAGISCKISNKEKFQGKRLFGETRLISLVFFSQYHLRSYYKYFTMLLSRYTISFNIKLNIQYL